MKRTSTLLLALTLLTAMTIVSTATAAATKDQRAVLSLWLNEEKATDLIVILRENDIWVAVDDMRSAGLHDILGNTEKLLGKTYISLDSVTPKLHFVMDEDALALRVTAPPEMFNTSIINLRPTSPKDLAHPQTTSAFLNYAASLANFVSPSGFIEAGLSTHGMLFSTTVSASQESGVVRGLSSLTIDNTKHLQRFVVGDSMNTTGELGGGLFVGGVSVSKNFDLDPYLIRQPSLGYAGSATTPSTLDVYVNGSRVYSERVAPGPFRVQDIPITSGSGDVRYVLHDVFGKEQAVTSPYTMVASQLADGQSQYNYAIGLRRKGMGYESFDYQGLVALGHHRIGISDKITLGARMELAAHLMSTGSTVDLLLPIGYTSISVAGSRGAQGMGVASALRYSYSSSRFSTSAMVQYLSDGYETVTLDRATDRSTLETRLSTTVTASTRFNFGANYWLTVCRDQAAQFRVGATARISLLRDLQIGLSASHTMTSDLRSSSEASLSLSYSFGGINATAGTTYNTERGPEASASINRPTPAATGLGFRASGNIGQYSRGDLATSYQGPYGRYQATFSVDAGGMHAGLEASGAIVAVKGAGIFATVPIQNGFAVAQVPGVKGLRVYLDNREVGKTDAKGNLLVPNMVPYYGSRIRISDQDLPLDYSVGGTEQILAPPYRGAAIAVFSAERIRYYRGHIKILRDGVPSVPVYGDLTVTKGKRSASSPIGKEGEFELEGLVPGHYTAQISHTSGGCVFTIDAPDDKGMLIDLGSLVCTP